jgi:hypothetical protein
VDGVTTPSKTTWDTVEFRLNRAAKLMSEVDSLFQLGFDTTEEDAANQIALTQLLVAAANAHLRIAEMEMTGHAFRRHQ